MVHCKMPSLEMIPHSKPTLDEEDVQAVGEVIRSGMIAQGEKVAAFEGEIAKRLGVRGGVATSSGTAALHLALLTLRVSKGDDVIIPSYVCTALLNAVRYVGARAVLCDINLSTYNIDPEDVRTKATERTKAIIVPHMFGLPADLDEILSSGVPVIEDCAFSFGATYKGKPVGSFGKMTMLSFYATKVITTGEGGMVLSDEEVLLNHAKDLREYDQKEDGSLRYNYKMTDLQGALGLSQLKKMERFILRRRTIAQQYSEAFSSLGLNVPQEDGLRRHIYYRYIIGLGPLGMDAESFTNACLAKGVCCCRPVFKPLHHYLGMQHFPNTERAWEQAVSVPIFPSLREEQVKRVIEVIVKICKNNRFRKFAHGIPPGI